MKHKSTSRAAFFNLRGSIIAVFCLTSVVVALVGSGAFASVFAQAKGVKANGFTPEGCFWSPGPDMPTTLVRAVGVYFTDGNFMPLVAVPRILLALTSSTCFSSQHRDPSPGT